MFKITALVIALYLAICLTLGDIVAPLHPSLNYDPIPARFMPGVIYSDGLHCEHLTDGSLQCTGFMPGGAWLIVQLAPSTQIITQSSILLIDSDAEINAGQLIERWGDPAAQRDVGWSVFLIWPHEYAAILKPLLPQSKVAFVAAQLDSMPEERWRGWRSG